jgi:tetratricopeptide (TPR) repeat protein
MAKLSQRLGLTRYEADEYYKKALQAYDKRQLSEAILAMEKAIELLPTNAEYLAARGFFYLEDGVIDNARTDFEESLKRHPLEVLAHYGLGIIAYRERQWEEAIAHFTQAYRANPERAETLYYLALAYHHHGQNGPALTYMQRAAEIFEKNNDRRRRDADRWIRQLEKQT